MAGRDLWIDVAGYVSANVVLCRDVARNVSFWKYQRNQHDPELRAHGIGFGKDTHDLIRRGIGGNIVVIGLAPEQEVAHATAHHISLMIVFAQRANDSFSVFFQVTHFVF